MALPRNTPNRYSNSRQLISGSDINNINDSHNSIQLLTASTTQTQAGAQLALINAANVLLTVGNANDAIALPLGYPGLSIWISNPAGNSAQVYGSGTDTINDVATATGVAQAASKTAIYTCVAVVSGVGKWYRILTA